MPFKGSTTCLGRQFCFIFCVLRTQICFLALLLFLTGCLLGRVRRLVFFDLWLLSKAQRKPSKARDKL